MYIYVFCLFVPIVHRKGKRRERGKRLGFHLSHNYVVNLEGEKTTLFSPGFDD